MNRGSNGIGPFVDLYLGEFDDQDRVLAANPISVTRPIWK